jgi:hypothetical protein
VDALAHEQSFLKCNAGFGLEDAAATYRFMHTAAACQSTGKTTALRAASATRAFFRKSGDGQHALRHLTRVKHVQLGNAIVGAAKPPAKLAVDILYHQHICVDIGLVVRVEISGRELVQHGWALRDDGG